MSFQPGTILTRRTPFEEPSGDAPDLRPYNEIEVVGPSPVQTAQRSEEWSGQLGDKLSVKPTTFGAVVDRSQGELQRDYEVTYTPPAPQIQRGTVEIVTPGPSPEEQFAADSAQRGEEKSEERVPTPVSTQTPEDAFEEAAGVPLPRPSMTA